MPDKPETIRSIGKSVALRLIVLLGIGLVAFLVMGDVGSIWPTGSLRPDVGEVSQRPEVGWPSRRGPRRDAVSGETGLVDQWPAEGPPVLWTRELGRGYSGFIAVGGRVYTQTQSISAQSVLCLDADTGRTIWEHRYGWPYEAAGMYPGPRSTPTWHDGRIYYAGPRGVVGCLRATDGSPLWELDFNEKFDGQGTDFGYSCSPVIEDGKLLLPVGGPGASLVALDPRDGSTVWASGDEPASYSSALPITLDGRRYVVVLLQNALSIFELGSGRLMWQEKFSLGYDEHAAAPLYDEPYLTITRPFQSGAECYWLTIDDGELDDNQLSELSAKTAWFSTKMSNDVASSVLVDGYLYGFDLRDVQSKAHRPSRGEFRCLEWATGEVVWSTDRPGHAAVLVADGKLILFNDRGELMLARATADGYEELSRTEVFSGEICWTAPALDCGRLYLRSQTRAACVYIGDPDRLERKQLENARPASEIPKSTGFNWTWFVGGEREYAFDPADLEELSLWYAFSLLGVIGLAALVATPVRWIGVWRWPETADRRARCVFWIGAFVLAMVGTPVYNRLYPQFIFTWPVCLFVAHQAALHAIVWSGRRVENRWSRWVALLATFFFLAVCVGYFLVCRRLSLAIDWIFLLGFLPCWPVAVPAAYALQRPGRPWRDLLWAVVTFSVYFWSVVAMIAWKMSLP